MADQMSLKLGYASSLLGVVMGVIYLVLLAAHFATASPGALPIGWVQLAGGILMMASVPVAVVLFCCITQLASPEKEILGRIGLSFTILFAAMTSINRFIQLTVIRNSSAEEQAAELARFLPYAEGSIMMALEFLAWGFFLSLACLAMAPLFSGSGLRRAIRWLFVAYGVLSLTSVVGYAAFKPLIPLGFIAWRPIFLALSICLTILFRRGELPSAP